MPAIDCTQSARTEFEIMHSAAFYNVPALFAPDHISHYFHHARHPQSIIGIHIIFCAADNIFQGSYRRHSQYAANLPV